MAQVKNFSISEALKFGFNTFFNNFRLFLEANFFFVGLYVAMYLIYALALYLRGNFTVSALSFSPVESMTAGLFALMASYSLLFFILKEYYIFQMIRYGLALYDGQPVHWKSALEAKNFFSFFGARCLFFLKCLLGFLLFFIPGIYIYCRYFFTGFPIIEGKALTAHEDTQSAQEVTKGVRWKIFWFHVINSVLMGLVAITIIGTLLIPIFILSTVHVYRTLGHYIPQDKQPELS